MLVDNRYSSTPSEEEEDKHELLTGEDIGHKRTYKASFTTHKEEPYGCPYGACGRKFVSADQLKQHVERRHAPNVAAKKVADAHLKMASDFQKEERKPEVSYEPIKTPVHPKMKNPIKKFEEDKLARPSTSGANMFFKAAPRPVTSHGRQ